MECGLAFFYTGLKGGIVAGSVGASIIFLILMKKTRSSVNQRLFYSYLHILFLIFPVFFYLFFRGCQMTILGCDQAGALLAIILISLLAAYTVGLVIVPYIFARQYLKKSRRISKGALARFVSMFTKRLNIRKPELYLIDIAKPLAFSISHIKNRIFLSIGLTELLTKKETEAVLLHELAHLKQRSSVFKFSTMLVKRISPLGWVTTFNDDLSEEEEKADSYVKRTQKTSRHLLGAKRKIEKYQETSKILH
jgi:Zn-dependent protease with chaperone function